MLIGLLVGTGVSFVIILIWFFAVDNKATLAHQRSDFQLAVMLRLSGVIVGTVAGVVVAWLLGGIWAGLLTIVTSLVCTVISFFVSAKIIGLREELLGH